MSNRKFSRNETIAYGLGAIGKDMVYALSASYVMYYYQDIMGLSAAFVGFILMIARIFDAINDPFMGVLVAKTNTKYGRFRPWIISGTVLNAFVLYALFAAPQLEGKSLMVYFAVVYILWGVTYTMMDIPYWSIIPAVTENPKDRESLSVVGRTCAGVGNALITVFTVIAVAMLGSGNERAGFKRFALIVSVLFVVFELILFLVMKEQAQDKDQMKTTSVGEMFRALFRNDQAVITVITIILINSALYITSNLIIYFFKYDLGPTVESWQASYTTFSTVGGGSQILSMMAVYPALRRFMGNTDIFKLCLKMSITGYALLLAVCFTPFSHNIIVLCAIGLLIFMANGMLTVLTTVFLSNSVDYGELKTGHREESVIFSMQTFVVKAASGVAVFLTGIGLDLIGLKGNSDTTGEIVVQSASTLNGLHLLMTIIPILGLIAAMVVFTKKFILTDEKAEEIAARLRGKEIPL
ncbi:MAG: MFS transporter [Solobacterium sp.]|nr:MFS transporter [Solobacterium sp.]MBQ1383363.1 MFS transporter [Solobacterium sp.]MBQ1446914.1 MFS transporter [Solobacterium sp.]MBQ6592365.1 MFS transporter [Solobacterium sp.]MBR0477718.1 MFS transporter [Solobacterium sp.]